MLCIKKDNCTAADARDAFYAAALGGICGKGIASSTSFTGYALRDRQEPAGVRTSGADGKSYKYYSSTTKTTYTNSSVTSGTKYYYKVKAINVVGDKTYYSKYSNAKSTIMLTTPVVKASLSSGKVKLSWDKVTGAKRYYVYTSTGGENFTFLKSTTALTFNGAALDEGASCWYRVKAVTTVSKTNYYSGLSDAVMAISEPAPEILSE